MKKLTSLLFVVLLGISTSAQSGYFSVRSIHQRKEFSFPILYGKANHRVRTKINQFLQLSELASLANGRQTGLFKQISKNDGSLYGRKVGLSYEIFANNSRVLSTGFYNSTDGATTHWWTSYYTFNAKNGDRISLRDLFTESGYERFLKLAIRRRSFAFRAEVNRKVEPKDRKAFLGILGSIEHDELSDFNLTSKAIVINGENLLGKPFCCEALTMKVVFRRAEFRRWLNDYGKIVFGIRSGNLAKYRSNRLPQLFSGQVGGASPFVAVFSMESLNEVSGIYAYLNRQEGKWLSGTIEGINLQLDEHTLTETVRNDETDSNYRWIKSGSISGTLNSGALNGVRSDTEKNTSASFVAHRR